MPSLPDEYLVRFTQTRHGRVRSRVLGKRDDGPPIAAVMGMAVADYLLPALSTLDWTRTHLIDLPGLAGSENPPHKLDVPGYAEAVGDWLDAADLPPVVLIGHSSGTQVAARAAAAHPDRVAAVVLASPTVDPKARSIPKALYYWRLDARYPLPASKRATVRSGSGPASGSWRTCCARICVITSRMSCRTYPGRCWCLRGEQDRLSTDAWVRHLVAAHGNGRLVTLPGPHTFLWRDPAAWREPIRELARKVST